MGIILDMTTRQLEEVVYYDSYIVTHVDKSIEDVISFKDIINTDTYYELKEQYGNKFTAKMGADALKTILKNMF